MISKRIHVFLIPLALALFVQATFCNSSTAQDPAAQQYTVMNVHKPFTVNPDLDPESREWRDANRKAREERKKIFDPIKLFLEGNAAASSVSSSFEAWFRLYEIARMTQLDDGTVSNLGAMRQEFFKDYFSDRVSNAGRKAVIDTTLPMLTNIVNTETFHPAARMNAILIIGQFDEQSANRNTGALPVPSSDALNYLLTVYKDAKYPPQIRVGAMTGLRRHLEIDSVGNTPRMSGPARVDVATEILAIANGGGTALDGWSDDGKYWMQRLAVQSLGLLEQPGPSGEVVDTLAKIIADNQARTMLRLDAVEALGKLNLSTVAVEKVDPLPAMLGSYLADTSESEAQLLRNKHRDFIENNRLFGDKDLEDGGNVASGGGNKPSSGRGMGGGGGLVDAPASGGLGGGGQSDNAATDKPTAIQIEIANYHLNASRRRIKVIAATTKEILTGSGSGSVSSSVKDPKARLAISGLVLAIDALIEKSDVGLIPGVGDEFKPVPPGLDDEDKPLPTDGMALRMAATFSQAANSIRGVISDAPGAPPAANAAAPANEFDAAAAPVGEFGN